MSHSCDESYEVYNETERAARKSHICGACRETIRPGDRYTRLFTVFDGETETIKRCARCQALHVHLREKCQQPGERSWDRLWPAEHLDCGEDYQENWGHAPPESIQELAFLLPGEQPGALLGLEEG